MVQTILETVRLRLREMTPDDLDFVAAMLGHVEVMQYWPAPLTRDEAIAWIDRQQRRYVTDGFGYWLAIEKDSDEPVGQAGLMLIEIDGVEEAGLGWIMHRPFWRRGYATEAARACIDWTIHTLGLSRAVAPIRPENEPSRAVARKLGLTLEKRTEYAGFPHEIHVISTPRRHQS